MDQRTKLSIIFISIIGVIVITGIWYGLSFDSKREKIAFTPQQLQRIQDCKDNNDINQISESSIVCYPKTENKHDIILLSTYPITGASLIQNIYEESTKISSYMQYYQNKEYIQACNFINGPWKLFCKGEGNTCLNQHPPPFEVPYFVNTNYPVYSKQCGSFGYPLPRHEKVLHIVRNPVDNIEAWIHYEFGEFTQAFWSADRIEDYIEHYKSWHEYWSQYNNKYPDIPSYWIRYEDLCFCLKQSQIKILEFTEASGYVDYFALNDVISINPCSTSKQVGKGVSYFSEQQLAYLQSEFKFVLKQFGYTELMKEFISHKEKNPTSNGAKEDYHESLWKDIEYGSHPSEQYCNKLLSIDWSWGNGL